MSNTSDRDTEVAQLTRRRFFTVTGGGVMALAAGWSLAACGSGGSSTSTSSTGAQGKPRTGGSLRVGLNGGSAKDSLDAAASLTEADIARTSQLYDTLMEYDADYKLRNALAEEVTSAKRATEWTIRLRKGVTFHDGKPLTAEDLRYTFLYITDPKSPGAAASRLDSLDRGNIKVLDDHTVQLTFGKPYAPFPDALGEGGTAGIRVIPVGYDPKQPVGTGPFKFKSFQPGQRSVFVRNEHYWRDGEPYVDEVVLIDFTDDAARVNALLSGQVDAIAGLPNSQAKIIKQNSAYTFVESVTGAWNPITMRVDTAPFDDVRVRQAFRLMANRKQLVTQVLDGRGSIANDVFARYDPASAKNLPQHPFDVEQAKSLLKAAGHEGLSAEFVTAPVSIGLVPAAEAFVQQASAAGVKLRLRKMEASAFFDNSFLKAPLSQSYWGSRNYLLQAADSMLVHSPYNETHWSDARWNQLVSEAFGVTNETKRAELIGAAQRIEHDKGGYLNWGWYNKLDATSTKVKGITPDRSGFSLSSYRLRQAWLTA